MLIRASVGDDGGEQATKTFLNVNKFAAQLLRTDEMFISYDWWALVVMREALEYPDLYTDDRSLPDVMIPTALAWLSISGPQIYTWDNAFLISPTKGDRGRGGPLWGGQHGFCRERWKFWKRRFGELSSSTELSEDLRKLANECAATMSDVEGKRRRHAAIDASEA